MPKTLIAQNVSSVNPLQWIWKEGELVDIICNCEVNYGELGLTHQVSILEDLTPEQVTKAKAVYQFLRNMVEAKFLED